jgi:hypothetical protein
MKFLCNRAMAILAISSAFLLAAGSCKKSTTSSSNPGMSATVNGNAWSGSNAVVGVYFSGGSDFNIAGVQLNSSDTTQFTLIFYTPITLNKTISSDTSQVVIAYLDGKTGAAYNGIAGGGQALITITSYDSAGSKIGGTFSGVLWNINNPGDSLVVANGKFNTSFQVQ